MPEKKFSELNEDGRVAVMFALATPALASYDRARIDLSLVPEQDVVNVIAWCGKTYLGDNFRDYLREVLERLAEEWISQAEERIAGGDFFGIPFIEVNLPKRYGLFSIFGQEVRETYEEINWEVLDKQIHGYMPSKNCLSTGLLHHQRYRRWLKVWLAYGRVKFQDDSFWQETNLEGWLREVAKDRRSYVAHHAQEILGEFYCLGCKERVPELLRDSEGSGWNVCSSCESQGFEYLYDYEDEYDENDSWEEGDEDADPDSEEEE